MDYGKRTGRKASEKELRKSRSVRKNDEEQVIDTPCYWWYRSTTSRHWRIVVKLLVRFSIVVLISQPLGIRFMVTGRKSFSLAYMVQDGDLCSWVV